MPVNTLTNTAQAPLPNKKINSDQPQPQQKTDADKTSEDYNDFLTLLTAQLKHQDPLQPLDSTAFVSQLAQFSNVEQQVKMNQKLDGLITSLVGSDFSEASNFLGKYVSAEGGKTYITAHDTQTQFSYKTDENVKSAVAHITDRFGNKIKDIQLPLAPTGASQDWDLTNTDNNKVEKGLYKINIQTTDEEGNVKNTPAITKVKILQANKTDTGFEYLTDTEDKITNNAIKTLHSQ
jgi:flagellar basal-body rod modification protein FlgD